MDKEDVIYICINTHTIQNGILRSNKEEILAICNHMNGCSEISQAEKDLI